MARSALFTREDVAAAGLALVRREGIGALTARAIAKELGCSLSPIFTLYSEMEAITNAVMDAGQAVFDGYMKGVTEFYPAFKEFGMRMIRFERNEPRLFAMLFSSPGSYFAKLEALAKQCIMDADQGYGLAEDQAELLFRQMWATSAGVVTLCSQKPDEFTEEVISDILSYSFSGMMGIIKSGRQLPVIVPRPKTEVNR